MEVGLRFGPADSGVLPFEIDGEQYALYLPENGRLPMGWAATGNWPALMPGCIHEPYRWEILHRLADRADPLGLSGCHTVAMGLAEDIYGVEWWTAEKVAATCHQNWARFGPWMAANGFNPRGEPAHRIVSAGLAWMFANVSDEKGARRLEAQLFNPPKPKDKAAMKSRPGFRPHEQAQQFQLAMQQLGGGG